MVDAWPHPTMAPQAPHLVAESLCPNCSGRMSSRPAKSTRTGCYRRARSLVMGTMIKMMLLLVAMSGSALPRATTEALPIPVNYDHHASSGHDHDSSGHDHHPETTRHGGHRERGELWHMAVDEAGQRCTTNPLLERKVDPNKYELGCAEIEVCLNPFPSLKRDVSSVIAAYRVL